MSEAATPTTTRSFLVLGGGSAGLLAALTVRQAFPQAQVTLLRSPTKPAIGVGESTTRAIPVLLHNVLKLPRAEFYREVQPVWKLGNRLEWGPAEQSHFNYPFDGHLTLKDPNLEKSNLYYCGHDLSHAGLYSSLMDQNRSPFVPQNNRLTLVDHFGYHIDNRKFLGHLEKKARERNVVFEQGDFADAQRAENGNVESIGLTDGRQLTADMFLDCSGFASLLLSKTLHEPYVSYADTLYCDRALVGSWPRQAGEELKLYTTTETMNHGWCWRIDFHDQVTRGYVYSSQFCTDDQARQELQTKNPLLTEDLRLIRFPSGRYERFWVGNVVAIGNSSGFIEPMEATALQLLAEQVRFFCKALLDLRDDPPPPRMIAQENRRNAARWNDCVDFLALHYKFNTRLDTPFWQHCRQEIKLGRVAEFVEYYQEVGASLLSAELSPEPSIFGFDGNLTMLLGQQVPTKRPARLTEQQQQRWRAHQQQVQSQAAASLPVENAWQLVNDPEFRWSMES